ncbi:MAG: hypothetical protein C0617_10090 [Desulfuromonas sp.]|uniref:hypothetical protein n=1 Tax=Desulfuromonas sp. TaxID=892 RepID=UPI000CBF9660|nr:hypothetical protein [Desulfuromonas sp.]PLX83866.1 MAG: hypothetical protein C0617_10090 [Desulfuromonas sp.]
MTECPHSLLSTWRNAVERVTAELARQVQTEEAWMSPRLERIAAVQRQIHELFSAAEGQECCRGCGGLCCDRGKNHLSLVNLLGFLCSGQSPPEPDFTRPCPFLGEGGCRLDPGRRPFNCVTFICEEVEARMAPADREAFYRLDADLRRLYGEFDGRYAGSSPRGLFIRLARLGDAPLLARDGREQG